MNNHTCIFIRLCAVFSVLLLSLIVYAENNAQYIRCEIPDTLITDQIFDATIYMKNTGTEAWGEGQTPVTLVSQDPSFDTTWGAYFIIFRRGTVLPGDTCAFSSKLKAPHTTGTYAFIWQCQNWGSTFDTTTPFFGQKVSGESIYVKLRTETPPPPPVHKDSLLDTSDFEYMGSFKLPNLPNQEDLFSESGLALRTIGQTKTLLVRTGTYNTRLYETSIPPLIKIIGGNINAIGTGVVVQDWGELDYGTIGGERIRAGCGFWFDDSSKILYWSHYNDYFTGRQSDFPMLMATRLNADGTTTNLHYWYLPDTLARFKSYWGGVTILSRRFASAYTSGRTMAVGFGGYYSICGSASRGPALGAIAKPNPSSTKLDLVEMMTYPDPVASPRDGNYIPIVNFWGDLPANPWEGLWTYNDYCRAGLVIDLPDKKGYVAFTRQVIGRIGYDYGGINIDPHTQQVWYFYNLDSLGAVALGSKTSESMRPSSFATFHYPIEHKNLLVTGACFDSASRMVYVYAMNSGERPIIHAYHIKESNMSVSQSGNEDGHIEGTIVVSPNPFNPSTKISFRSKREEFWKDGLINIYTINGKKIFSRFCNAAALAEGIVWDASGRSSGIYIIKVSRGNIILTKALTITK